LAGFARFEFFKFYGFEFGKKLTKPLAIIILAIALPRNQDFSGIFPGLVITAAGPTFNK
jgi:hypothetical protein